MSRGLRPLVLIPAILFQLMLLVGAYGCGGAGTGEGSPASMAGMTMPGGDQAAPASSPAGDRELPCQLPAALSGCQAMAPCTIAPCIVVPPQALTTGALMSAPIATLELQVPASVSLAPELPPPRA